GRPPRARGPAGHSGPLPPVLGALLGTGIPGRGWHRADDLLGGARGGAPAHPGPRPPARASRGATARSARDRDAGPAGAGPGRADPAPDGTGCAAPPFRHRRGPGGDPARDAGGDVLARGSPAPAVCRSGGAGPGALLGLSLGLAGIVGGPDRVRPLGAPCRAPRAWRRLDGRTPHERKPRRRDPEPCRGGAVPVPACGDPGPTGRL
ncbi:MAG: hypothetical protein AVDCRST_MAG15-1298, partial [uncultured Rubellimicrobium sp.]